MATGGLVQRDLSPSTDTAPEKSELATQCVSGDQWDAAAMPQTATGDNFR